MVTTKLVSLQLGGRELTRAEVKRREGVWDLFQSELVFLIDHLMVLKNVSQHFLPSDDCRLCMA